MMTKKTLLPTNDVYIQFTEEELSSIGAGPGTKFEAKLHDDGSIELRPYVKVELNMEDWPREVLELIVKESCEKDISANDIINKMLKEGLNMIDKQYNSDASSEAVFPTAWNSNYSTYSSDTIPTLKTKLSTTSGYDVYTIDPNFTNNDISLTESYAYKNIPERDMLFRNDVAGS